MLYIIAGILVVIVIVVIARKRKRKALTSDQVDFVYKMTMIEPSDDDDFGSVIRGLFAWTVGRMVLQLPQLLSDFRGQRVSEDVRNFMALECAIYLYFRGDVLVFNSGAGDQERINYEKLVLHEVIDTFESDEFDVRAFNDFRFKDYTNAHASKSVMRSPESILVENLHYLAEYGQLNQSLAIPIQDAISAMMDFTAIVTLPATWMFKGALSAAFADPKLAFSEMDAGLLRSSMTLGGMKATVPMPKAVPGKSNVLVGV